VVFRAMMGADDRIRNKMGKYLPIYICIDNYRKKVIEE
jgi:hypothetical protein